MNSSTNDAMPTFHPSGDGAIVWQPVIMAPMKTDDRKSKYPGMQTVVIHVLSAICIFLGIASIGIQIAALVIYSTSIYPYTWFSADVSGHGIWAGSFYVIAGCLGIASAYKRTKLLLVLAVVLSGLSIAMAIISSILSGITASDGVFYSCYSSDQNQLCDVWVGLEWSLLATGLMASICSITLIVLTSVPLCCSSNNAAGIQQGVYFGERVDQQPMQQYHPHQPNFQSPYVPQPFYQQSQMQLASTVEYAEAPNAPISVQQKNLSKESESVDTNGHFVE